MRVERAKLTIDDPWLDVSREKAVPDCLPFARAG